MAATAVDRLAERLVAHLTENQEDHRALAEAVCSFYAELSDELAQYVGRPGWRAILLRSLGVAQHQCSLPLPLSALRSEPPNAEELAEAMKGLHRSTRRQLVACLISNLIEVINDLLAIELTQNLLMDTRPEIDWGTRHRSSAGWWSPADCSAAERGKGSRRSSGYPGRRWARRSG